jgi:MtrB/PioB family decaheme-associated outer membrane protein
MIMTIPKQQLVFRRSILAVSVLLSIGAAYAEDDDVEALTKNQSTISMGAGVATGDYKSRSIFSQYNGYNSLINGDINPLFDFNVIKLKEASGVWVKLEGHNLAQDNRELNFSINKQGDWKYSFDYNEITHHEIRTINTALQGAGTTTPTVKSLATAGIGADINLQLQRKAATVGVEKWLSPSLLFETSFKNEDKNGARLSGVGITCGLSRYSCGGYTGAMLMLPEPVNSSTKQIEAKLHLSMDKLLLTAGYYGSFYSNVNGSMNSQIPGNLYKPDGTTVLTPSATLVSYLTSPFALPPDNESHQFYLSGNYAFTPTTRSNFKFAQTHSTQNENFLGTGLTGGPAGAADLGGVVDTTLAQFGLSARPTTKLAMLVNLRYEDKNDKTPNRSYNLTALGLTPATPYSNNYSSSSKKINGKLESTYQLSRNYRATLGVDYATVDRAIPPSATSLAATDLGYALGGLREGTREVGYRAELRRALSDTLNAAVSFGRSLKNGGNWTIYDNAGTLPMTMMDRKRDKIKMLAEWLPTNSISLQFNLESGKDSYTGPIEVGMRDNKMGSYGVDGSYTLSDNWKLTAYLNQSMQTQHVSHTALYLAELVNTNTSVGFGVVGKPTSRLDVGGNIAYLYDNNRYGQAWSNGHALTGGGLPDVSYRLTSTKLYGKYSLEKHSDLRVDLIYQNAKLDEWTWSNNGSSFAYSDNTTVSMKPNQNVVFLGTSYIYKFR